MQMVLSSIAESGREAISGPLSSLFRPQQTSQQSVLESLYSEGKPKPTLQEVITAFNEDKANLKLQREQKTLNMRLIGGFTKVLSFVFTAIGFTASMFLGPVAALTYTTLATYCYSEGISLKGIFSKAFNPIKVAISNSKVGDYVRNNKMKVLGLIGIGALSVGMMGLQVLLPSLNLLWSTLSAGIGTIGMVYRYSKGNIPIGLEKGQNKKIDDLYYSLAQMTHHLYDLLLKEMPLFGKQSDFSKDIKYIKGKFDEYYRIWETHHQGDYWTQRGTVKIKTMGGEGSHTYNWFLERFIRAYEKIHGSRDDDNTRFVKGYGNYIRFIQAQYWKNLEIRDLRKPRIVLFEMLQDIFPKFWGVSFSHNRIAQMVFTGYASSQFLAEKRVDSRVLLASLFEIDYNTHKLTEDRFETLGIKISSDQLRELKSRVSDLIKSFIFSNPYTQPYINKLDKVNDLEYIESKYDLYRSLYFLESENRGSPISFEALVEVIGTAQVQSGPFLADGTVLVRGRVTYNNIKFYLKSQQPSELRSIALQNFYLHSQYINNYLPRLVGTYTHDPIELLILMSLNLNGFKNVLTE